MSRISQDITNLTIQSIYPRNKNGSFIPALRTLTSDGVGGTYWAIPSTLGVYPAYTSVVVDNVEIPAIHSTNTLYLSSSVGIGLSPNEATSRIDIFGKSFGGFIVSSGNTLLAYSNSIVTPNVNLIGTSGIRIDADPLTQTLKFSGIPTAISTGVYAYNQINVISNAVDFETTPQSTILTAPSPTSVLTMMGTGDVLLSTQVTKNTVVLSISSFTSEAYLSTSTLAANAYPFTLSTTSTLFYDIPRSVSTTQSLVDTMITLSTGIHTKFVYDNTNLQNNYTTRAYFDYITIPLGQAQATQDTQINRVVGNSLSTFTVISSMGVETNAIGTGFTDTTSTFFEFSTVSFRLDSLSSLFNYNVTTQVTYNPSLWFSYSTDAATILRYISTGVRVGTTLIPEVKFTRPFHAVFTVANLSNLYTDRMTLIIPKEQILQNITSTFTLYHTMKPFQERDNNQLLAGLQSVNYLNDTDPNAGVTVTITGSVPPL